MRMSDNLAVDGNRDKVNNIHCNDGQRPLQLLTMAAVMAGKQLQRHAMAGKVRQSQAKAAAAMVTVTPGNSSKGTCKEGQQPLS